MPSSAQAVLTWSSAKKQYPYVQVLGDHSTAVLLNDPYFGA